MIDIMCFSKDERKFEAGCFRLVSKTLIFLLFFCLNESIVKASSESDFNWQQLQREVVAQSDQATIVRWKERRGLYYGEWGTVQEFNNFESKKVSVGVLIPGDFWHYTGSLGKIMVNPTDSSTLLSGSPLRQGGRPSRLFMNHSVAVAVLEGVGTQPFSPLPEFQFVFFAHAGGNWNLYPELWAEGGIAGAALDVVGASLSDSEQAFLQERAPPAMKVSRSRLDIALAASLMVIHPSGLMAVGKVSWEAPIGDELGLGSIASFMIGVGSAM